MYFIFIYLFTYFKFQLEFTMYSFALHTPDTVPI